MLGKCLASCGQTLEILDLNDNGIDDSGIHALSIEKLEKLTSLHLHFGHTQSKTFGTVGISDQGATSLARGLKACVRGKRLELIDVQCHQISSRGVVALVHAIMVEAMIYYM